jgi:hypothetical protein
MDGQTHDVCTGMFTHVKTFAGEVVTITSILKITQVIRPGMEECLSS